MKHIFFYLTISIFIFSCTAAEQSRFIAYRYPSKDVGYTMVSEYSKEFATMLVHDTISNQATYLVAPLHRKSATMLIIRSADQAEITPDYLNFKTSYDIYHLDLMTGELYDCGYAYIYVYTYIDLPYERSIPYNISYAKNFLLDSTGTQLWYGGKSQPPPRKNSCLDLLYNEKLYPERFPNPLIRIEKIDYRELSVPILTERKNEKRLRPALEALFSGRPILEVDSLLKIGFKGINQDVYKLK